MLSKLLALLAVMAVSVATSILVSIYGWGLTPHSWKVIIGVGFIWQTFWSLIGERVLKELREEKE